MNSLAQLLLATVQQDPQRLCLFDRGVEYSYAEVHSQAQRLAQWLVAHGVQPGDRVGLLLVNSLEYLCAALATWYADAVVVAIHPEANPREILQTLGQVDPSCVVVGKTAAGAFATALPDLMSVNSVVLTDDVPETLTATKATVISFTDALTSASGEECVPQRAHDELAQIIFTSGTSGQPKGVMLSHRNLLANTRAVIASLSITQADRALVILPFYYSYGNSVLLSHLMVGGGLVLAPDFVFWNRVLDLLETRHCTGLAGVPSTFAMLLHRSDFKRRKLAGLRYVSCAGGALAPSRINELRAALPQVAFYAMYGQTEATARLSCLSPHELERKLGSIGRGLPGVTLRVLDEHAQESQPHAIGELVAQGPNLMLGYWNDVEGTIATLRPEGLRTGDLAYRDDDGYLFIVGRKSDLIKSGSYRIHPQELEEVILTVPGVAEVAVRGEPDDVLGEIAVAFVVPTRWPAEVTAEAILHECRLQLPRYKQIRRVEFRQELPRTPNGKVRRAALCSTTLV